MLRFLAIASYVYQSAAAILLIFTVSHVLQTADYTAFSLALATSQFLSVLAFEWLQLAGVRFLASAEGLQAAEIKSALFTALALSAAVLFIVGTIAGFLKHIPMEMVTLGLAIAIVQEITDLHFMMIRVSGRLGLLTMLMIARATTLFVVAVAGALKFGSAEGTLLGMLAGQTAGLFLGSIRDLSLREWKPRRTQREYLGKFCQYGMRAAAASVIHLSIPVMIRMIVIGRLGEAGAASAGFSMALDILQRPYTVLVSAIHTVTYPDVVASFDRSSEAEARRAAARLFEFVICTTIVMLGGLIAFLPDAAQLFVPLALQSSFLAVAPAATTFFFLHTHLQATLAVVPHLRKAATRLIIVAGAQLVLTSVLVSSLVAVGMPPTSALWGAACATGLTIIAASGPTARFGAHPRVPLVAAAVAAGLTIGALVALPSYPLVWLAGKAAVAGIIVTLIAWQGGFLTAVRKV